MPYCCSLTLAILSSTFVFTFAFLVLARVPLLAPFFLDSYSRVSCFIYLGLLRLHPHGVEENFFFWKALYLVLFELQ
jgi:hypothetical protein